MVNRGGGEMKGRNKIASERHKGGSGVGGEEGDEGKRREG